MKFISILLSSILFSCNSTKDLHTSKPAVMELPTVSSTENVSNPSSEKDTFQKKVYVWLKEDSISFKKLDEQQVLTVFNNSDNAISFEPEVIVQNFNGEDWQTMNNGIVFQKMSYVLQPGKKVDLNFSPKIDGRVAFPGIYRIKKPFIVSHTLQLQYAITDFKVYTPLIEGLNQEIFFKIPKTIKMSEIGNKIGYEIINNQKKTILFGDRYQIEKFDGKQWQEIKLSSLVNDIGYILYPGSKSETDLFFRLHPEQYQYKPGLYRITKFYSFADEKGDFRALIHDKQSLVATFSIVP